MMIGRIISVFDWLAKRITEFVVFSIALCIALFIFLVVAEGGHHSERPRRAACVNNLRQLGLALALYANENRDRYPPIDDRPWNLMFEGDVMYPEYLTNMAIVGCPSDPSFNPHQSFRQLSSEPDGWFGPWNTHTELTPDCLDSTSYQYSGWFLHDGATEKDFTPKRYAALSEESRTYLAGVSSHPDAWARALRELHSALDWGDNTMGPNKRPTNAWRDNNLNLASFGFTGSGNTNSDTLLRLGNIRNTYLDTVTDDYPVFNKYSTGGVGTLYETVPVMWDEISTNVTEFSHVPAGQNILYLDGHVEFVRYSTSNTRFPSTPLAAAILGSIEIAPTGDPRTPWGECP